MSPTTSPSTVIDWRFEILSTSGSHGGRNSVSSEPRGQRNFWMTAGEMAVVTMKLDDLRAAFEFVMKSSRTSRARITIDYDGRELLLLRTRSSARVPAEGHWPGVVTIYG